MTADVHMLRHGYNLADLDRLARISVRAAWSQAGDRDEAFHDAWNAIAEALYACEGRPEPWDLKRVGMDAVNESGRHHRRHHGFDHRNPDAGYGGRARFVAYWELGRIAHSCEQAVVDRVSLWQIWPRLSDTDRRTLLALVAHDGDQLLAAQALDKSRSAYATALWTARRRFLALWHEHETPRPRQWGKVDKRRSDRYSATQLLAIRRNRRIKRLEAAS